MIATEKFIFIHNPRTSGTNIISYLSINFKNTKKHVHLKWNECIYSHDNKYVFGFVRNPFSREFSYYRRLRISEKISFKQYIMESYFNAAEQYVWFTDSTGNIPSFINIFKYEERNNSLATIAEYINVDPDDWIKHNTYINTYGPTREWRSQWDNEMIDYMMNIYKHDMKLFNYDI